MQAKLKAKWIALLLLVAMLPASATFHFMKVVEIFPGTAAAPNAHYVVIQMYASGQNFVGGHDITAFNGAGTLIATFTFPGSVARGVTQDKILIATAEAEAFFGLTADLSMSPSLLAAGGKVCFAGTVDCVAWGAYTGSTAGVGTPFNAGGGLQSGRAAIRRLDIAGAANLLEGTDDTNNCANDFVVGLPAPRNNAGVLGTVPGATCGNGALEGLEECDDGNLFSNDGCSSSCVVDVDLIKPPRSDFDNDGKSDILWRNGTSGANAIWRSANSATSQAVTGVTSLAWIVAGVGDINADNKSDIVWRNTANGANAVWYSANSGTAQNLTGVTNQQWKIVGVADFTGDGKSDLLWRNFSTGANVIWRSANAATPQGVTSVTSLAWIVAGVGDINADNKSDIVWRNTANGANAVWYSANSGTAQNLTGVTNQQWKIVGVADFTGDGKSDLLWRNFSTGANVIWRSANAATPQSVTALITAWIVAAVGDYNGDTRADIIWRRNTSSGANAVWYSANFAAGQSLTAVNLQWRIVP